jgi:hypothetical protein
MNNLNKKKENSRLCNTDNSEQFDIFHIDEKIKKIINQESKKIEQYKNEMENLQNIFNTTNTTNKRDKKKKELSDKIELLKQKIYDIENDIPMAEYIYITSPIIEKYKKMIHTPVKLSFFNRKENIANFQYSKENIENEKYEILDEYYDIAKKYITIKSYKKETPQKYICECGNLYNYTEIQNKIICNDCSNTHSIQSIQTSFKDIDRVNLSQKYKYKKQVHFRDTVNQYQGKQNKRIEQNIYIILEEQFLIHNLVNVDGKTYNEKYSNITKEHIYMFLFETNNSNYYEDINMIHTHFTGIPCPDISDIEHLLYEDFNKVVDSYESLEDIDRIHFLNGQYILYQLLRRRKIKVKESDFDILKTRERLVEHDEIYQKICMKLEWTFNPTV